MLLAACRELTEDDIVFVLCGVYQHQLRSHGAMIKALGQSRATLGAISQGNMPRLESGLSLRSPHALLGAAIPVMRRFSFFPAGRSSGRGAIFRRLLGLRALDYIWVGVTVLSIDSRLIGPETKIDYIHNLDYDNVIGVSLIPPDQSQTAVLLDHMGFRHPDALTLGLDISGLDEEAYFAGVRTALDEFEEHSGLTAEIAAHPRAQPGSLDALYGGRKVRYLETPEAIAQSQVVLVMNASTAVGLAVALNRPMIVLQSSVFFIKDVKKNTLLAGLLRLPIVDLDLELRDWAIPVIDEGAYESYLRLYVKRADTPELPFWDVVADSIQTTI
jgi:hypothetical protein